MSAIESDRSKTLYRLYKDIGSRLQVTILERFVFSKSLLATVLAGFAVTSFPSCDKSSMGQAQVTRSNPREVNNNLVGVAVCSGTVRELPGRGVAGGMSKQNDPVRFDVRAPLHHAVRPEYSDFVYAGLILEAEVKIGMAL